LKVEVYDDIYDEKDYFNETNKIGVSASEKKGLVLN
jgi:hypothetical protein